jgi:hypothetical protein
MEREKIEKLRELLAKATPGPWSTKQVNSKGYNATFKRPFWEMGGGPNKAGVGFIFGDTDANAALIVAAVNALPQLLSELDAPTAASNQVQCASCYETTMVADGIPGSAYCQKCQPAAPPDTKGWRATDDTSYGAGQIMDDAFAERLADDRRVVAHLKAVPIGKCACPVHEYLAATKETK